MLALEALFNAGSQLLVVAVLFIAIALGIAGVLASLGGNR